MSPLGLFAFSMLICLHTVDDFMAISSDVIAESYKALWACYAFWIGGFLQLWVGGWEALRGNVYGATAFSAFGCFWLANGTLMILRTFFNLPEGAEYLEPTQIGGGIKDFWILIFVFVLFKQTLIMNRVSTAITVVLSCWIIVSIISEFYESFNYAKVIFGALLCSVGFYGFMAELTNEVYPEEPMPMWPVRQNNAEIFGAAGRSRTLKRSLIDLRTTTGMEKLEKRGDSDELQLC
jgi:succinate-acetate transporter protein